jgi:hypothetical protein
LTASLVVLKSIKQAVTRCVGLGSVDSSGEAVESFHLYQRIMIHIQNKAIVIEGKENVGIEEVKGDGACVEDWLIAQRWHRHQIMHVGPRDIHQT